MTIQTVQAFDVNDLVRVDGDQPDHAPWRITEIVTDNAKHDGPYAILEDTTDGGRSWAALRILYPYTPCPPGCAGHIDGAVHISVEQTVLAAAYASDSCELYVSLERDDELGHAAVRLMGANDAPMTPAEALQLAGVLTTLAFAAATTWAVCGGSGRA